MGKEAAANRIVEKGYARIRSPTEPYYYFTIVGSDGNPLQEGYDLLLTPVALNPTRYPLSHFKHCIANTGISVGEIEEPEELAFFQLAELVAKRNNVSFEPVDDILDDWAKEFPYFPLEEHLQRDDIPGLFHHDATWDGVSRIVTAIRQYDKVRHSEGFSQMMKDISRKLEQELDELYNAQFPQSKRQKSR